MHSTLHLTSAVQSLDFCNGKPAHRNTTHQPGSLICSTTAGVEFWRIDSNSEVVVWDRLWDRPYPNASRIILSPACTHIAWHSEVRSTWARKQSDLQGQKVVSVIGLDRKGGVIGVPQTLQHPRGVSWIGWRKSSTSQDSFLYNITSNGVFRIYGPVLDDPTWFQLLHSFDSRAFGPNCVPGTGSLSVVDASTFQQSLKRELELAHQPNRVTDPSVVTTMKTLECEEGDVVFWLGYDGNVGIRSISVSTTILLLLPSLMPEHR